MDYITGPSQGRHSSRTMHRPAPTRRALPAFRLTSPIAALAAALLIHGCAAPGPVASPQEPAACPAHAPAAPGFPVAPAACPACPACPPVEPPKPAEKPFQPAGWADLPGWAEDDLRPAFRAFRASCGGIEKQPIWRTACEEARAAEPADAAALRAWFEGAFQPWAMTNPDGSREGLITGYYEPVLKGSRSRAKPYLQPVFGPPEDMVTVDLAELYPELKHLRLRGRLEGRRLVPYYSRAEWAGQETKRSPDAILWVDDALEFFFMQIQGSGLVELKEGGRIRLNYADQNGHPYRSIGRWLADQGEMKLDQTSMPAIKAWARANPGRVQELMNANPSLVFFRELPATGDGPPGAMAVPLTPQRSIAIDPRILPLGAPVFLAAAWPGDGRPLRRLMVAQDTGGAIRGPVRADFYWGTGGEAGAQAGRMRQQGRMWTLLPRGYTPK